MPPDRPISASACREKTGALTAAQQQRLESEGIVRRADDLTFRYTHDAGRRDAGWEDRRASIIVTKQSVIIHKNEKLGLERAEAVMRYLYEQHQIPLFKMNVISYGEDNPVAENNTKAGRAQNRRVVIRVLV